MLTAPSPREVRIRADLVEEGCEGSGVFLGEARGTIGQRDERCEKQIKVKKQSPCFVM